ncbi:hypothetical protein M885DRAFT_572121 [Pelagophyceae sp. CCMP2097]|nr:hypothetical protein M885DRAFT_572121 [Pelagophyceae sp. CCMP2097]
MSGARKALDAAGCVLVGGHTCEGAELALGFAINGVASDDKFLSKEGLRAGDVLLQRAAEMVETSIFHKRQREMVESR